MEDLIGKTFGPYQIVASLGEGGMAAVYKAYHPATDRYVALKVLLRHLADHPLFSQRFRQEAKVLAQLQHPHILPLFDFGEADGYAYIVMPLLTHGTLNDLLRGQPLPLKQILLLMAQVGDALDYAHARGIIHRDVKPSNVLLDERGNCLLTDFGLTKTVTGRGAKLTTTGAIMGTPAYMSPEQGLGEKLDGRSDIYSLGVILYEMATGRVPYRAETPMATVIQHINDPLAPPRTLNPALSEAVEQVILKTLAKRPEDRYATAADMVQALQVAITDPTSDSTVELPAAPKPEKRPLPPEKSKSAPGFLGMPMWASVVGGLVLIGAVAGLFAIFGGGNQTRHRAATQTVAAVAALVATTPPPTGAETAGRLSATPPPTATASQTPTLPAPPTPTLGAGSTQIAEKDHMVEVYVPAGEFLMGSADSDKEASVYEKPPHTVYVDAFWIDRTEITNGMYGLCVQAGACRRPGSAISPTRSPYYGNLEFNDYPVIYVAWNEAKGYCAWAGRRLPTEAEWEKAARGTDGRIYPWGATPPSAARANFNSIKGDTTPVGSYPDSASPYGALDMAGNVAEWVSDWYLGAYYTEASAANPNPQGPASGSRRVIRGGAWNSSAQSIRAANRDQFGPSSRYNFIGFRCAH